MYKRLFFLSIFVFPFTLLANDEEMKSCVNNLQELTRAFHSYHAIHKRFPPPFTVDANGKPLHSWRTLILPYMNTNDELYERLGLFENIRFDEPWDSTHNKQFHDKMPTVFRCSQSTRGNPERDTIYCMVVGKETIGSPDGEGTRINQITDGTSNTVMLVERKTPVCWMEPTDVLQEHAYLGVNKHERGIGSEHPGRVVVSFADSSIHFLKENADLKTLKAFLTKAGGELPDASQIFE